MKKLAVKHKDVINPILAGLKSGATKGVAKLSKAAQDKIDSNINTIAGEGVKRRGRPKKQVGEGLLGDALKEKAKKF